MNESEKKERIFRRTRAYLKSGASGVALLLLREVRRGLPTRTLATGRFAFSASHCLLISGVARGGSGLKEASKVGLKVEAMAAVDTCNATGIVWIGSGGVSG